MVQAVETAQRSEAIRAVQVKQARIIPRHPRGDVVKCVKYQIPGHKELCSSPNKSTRYDYENKHNGQPDGHFHGLSRGGIVIRTHDEPETKRAPATGPRVPHKNLPGSI